jgi:Flp pilus assembly pilin Flp
MMRTHLKRLVRDERGLTTAEYAVGTVAVAGLGGVLAKLLASEKVRELIWGVIKTAFKTWFGG